MKNKEKSKEIATLLLNLRLAEEYQTLTDSEYTDIVETTYKMNPQFFTKYIYPEMMKWDFSAFNRIKNDFITFIEKLNETTSV